MAERAHPIAMRGPSLVPAVRRLVPALVLAVFALAVAAIAASAGDTLGYDYRAYERAADRLLAGEPVYDPAVDVAGGFAIYLYPPPFVLLAVPFALLPGDAGLWAWLALLVGSFLAGVALLPVGRGVRWTIVLLAGLSWPFLYTAKLGQVTPLLFLGFAAGWRWLDRPAVAGAAAALGTAIKLQPGLLFGWLLATRRWPAFATGLVVLAVLGLVGLLLVGPDGWADYVALLGRVSSPVTTPHNFTPGGIAFQAGVPEATAGLVQWAWLAVVAAITVFAWFRRDAATSYVTTVVASQAVSPLLWDHYAMVLLIPVALLLARRRWWAALIPLVTWLSPPILYQLSFAVALVAPLADHPVPGDAS